MSVYPTGQVPDELHDGEDPDAQDYPKYDQVRQEKIVHSYVDTFRCLVVVGQHFGIFSFAYRSENYSH